MKKQMLMIFITVVLALVFVEYGIPAIQHEITMIPIRKNCKQIIKEFRIREKTQEKYEKQLRITLNYLNEINNVKWVKFVRGEDIDDEGQIFVFIGFNPIPSDLDLIIGEAALKGNKAINFIVGVYAVDAKQYIIYDDSGEEGNGIWFRVCLAHDGKIQNYYSN